MGTDEPTYEAHLPSTQPVWIDAGHPPAPQLTHDQVCDVCVVGAGIAGLLIAERLVREGLRVVVLEQGPLACGETAHTTAHFSCALDDRFYRLDRMHGEEGARAAAASHTEAIAYAELLVRRLGIQCGFRRLPGYLVVHGDHRDEPDGAAERVHRDG